MWGSGGATRRGKYARPTSHAGRHDDRDGCRWSVPSWLTANGQRRTSRAARGAQRGRARGRCAARLQAGAGPPTSCFRQRQQAPERRRLALRSPSRGERQRQRGATGCKAATGVQQGDAADEGRLELVHTLLSADSPGSKASACEALVRVGPSQLIPSVRRAVSMVRA